jgi:DNA-binding NarL/FixJ family response regulator
MNAPIRIATVEDDRRYRESLELLFRHVDDFRFGEGFEAPAPFLERIRELSRNGEPAPWDLVLMDLDLPGLHGVECIRQVRARFPKLLVVVLTVFEDRGTIVDAICAGADGYLLKQVPAPRLLEQLRAVVAGGAPLSAGVARTVLELIRDGRGEDREDTPGSLPRHARVDVGLTPRELDVLRCLVQGKSYKAVARALDVSIDTVRSHIRSVYRKLQVHSVAEAVARALRDRIV